MEIIEALKSRHSCRKYDPKPVPKELVVQIVEAGRLTCSGKNLQPWHFYVVMNPERNKELGKTIQPILEEKVPAYVGKKEAMGVSNTLFYDPPVIIHCTVQKDGLGTKYLDLGLALQSMMLAAEKLGLCTLPVAQSKWFGEEIVCKDLGIPDTEEFFLSLCVGYPDVSVPPTLKPRKELSEVATFFE